MPRKNQIGPIGPQPPAPWLDWGAKVPAATADYMVGQRKLNQQIPQGNH